MPENIFLIGYRCTGKTTVGKLLAGETGWQFADADAEVEAESGMSIADMVARHGWPYFREQERTTLQRLCRLTCHIISTGGGVILDPENIRDMKAAGTVIWLKASPETIIKRLLADSQTLSQRPALTDQTWENEIRETLAQRMPLYEQAGDVAVETDRISIQDICRKIRLAAVSTGY